ncbi:Glycosyl phosphatidyl inositol protein transamidase complex subunit, partial [Nowakowskiella sp. JEL0078]
RSNFISKLFDDIGIDSEVQEFKLLNGSSGFNSYGISRAPRADGTEAILLSAPWICENGEQNLNGISYLLSFASFAQKFSHWAKDLIFIVYDNRITGMNAWLESYHGNVQVKLKSETLKYHGGVIHEAINLEFCGTSSGYSAIGVFIEGLNGQQSNCDMVTTVVRSAQAEGITIVQHDSSPSSAYFIPGSLGIQFLDQYPAKFKKILKFMKSQALGIPRHAHGLLQKYRIEAVTIFGVRGEEWESIGALKFGLYLESTLRALNNLLERLHHAQWFYLLSSVDTFIPLAVYIGPVILLPLSLLLKALALWHVSGNSLLKPSINSKHGYSVRSLDFNNFFIVISFYLLSQFIVLTIPTFFSATSLYLLPAFTAFLLTAVNPSLSIFLSIPTVPFYYISVSNSSTRFLLLLITPAVVFTLFSLAVNAWSDLNAMFAVVFGFPFIGLIWSCQICLILRWASRLN